MRQQQSDQYEISLTFDRGNSTYKPEQTVTGKIQLTHKTLSTFKLNIESLTIAPIGLLSVNNKQNNQKITNILKQLKPIKFIDIQPIQLAKNKTLNQTSQTTFRFKLAKQQHKYIQTYVGVYITIIYQIQVNIKIANNPTPINNLFTFYIQVPKQGFDTITQFIYPKKKNFIIQSQNVKGNKVPKFKIRGELTSQIIYFSDDLNGMIIIDQAQTPIRSIDVQMFRVEKLTYNTQSIIQRTQIQMIQMCDGNVTRNLQLPIYMILPRYYSCPSFNYLWAQVDFQIDLMIIFKDGFKITVNIPLKLIRN